jgi:hypothetical protein
MAVGTAVANEIDQQALTPTERRPRVDEKNPHTPRILGVDLS